MFISVWQNSSIIIIIQIFTYENTDSIPAFLLSFYYSFLFPSCFLFFCLFMAKSKLERKEVVTYAIAEPTTACWWFPVSVIVLSPCISTEWIIISCVWVKGTDLDFWNNRQFLKIQIKGRSLSQKRFGGWWKKMFGWKLTVVPEDIQA